jgi:ankyrin repeat protein
VKSDSIDGVAALFKAGAAVDAPDTKYRLTALFLANSAPVADILLSHGANLKGRNMKGQTPFEYLTFRIGSTFPSDQAIKVAGVLLQHGADINSKDQGDGSTPLMAAVTTQVTPYVSFLLDQHADVNLRNNNGDTVLRIAMNLQSAVNSSMAAQYGELAGLLRAHGATQ